MKAFADHQFKTANLEDELSKTYNDISDCAASAYNTRYHDNNKSRVSKSWWTPELSRFVKTSFLFTSNNGKILVFHQK